MKRSAGAALERSLLAEQAREDAEVQAAAASHGLQGRIAGLEEAEAALAQAKREGLSVQERAVTLAVTMTKEEAAKREESALRRMREALAEAQKVAVDEAV